MNSTWLSKNTTLRPSPEKFRFSHASGRLMGASASVSWRPTMSRMLS